MIIKADIGVKQLQEKYKIFQQIWGFEGAGQGFPDGECEATDPLPQKV